MTPARFRVLGPVELLHDGDPVRLGRGTALTVLAGLLTSPNQVVPVDQLIDWVWGREPPFHPRAALQNGVSRLRQLIGEPVLDTFAWGYRLHAGAGQLDLLRFDELRCAADRAAGRGAVEDAAAALDEAVGLWREPLLGNVESLALHEAIVPGLRERYLDTIEIRAGLYIQLGRPDPVIRDLAPVVRVHPYREPLTGQLMVALALSGRPADALSAYTTLRRTLRDELGLDPSAELQRLHLKILRADRNLDLPPFSRRWP
mgnify:CR=1 FL=1